MRAPVCGLWVGLFLTRLHREGQNNYNFIFMGYVFKLIASGGDSHKNTIKIILFSYSNKIEELFHCLLMKSGNFFIL